MTLAWKVLHHDNFFIYIIWFFFLLNLLLKHFDFFSFWLFHSFLSFVVRSLILTYFLTRGGSRTAATSQMENFEIIVNSWRPLTVIRKSSILDVSAVLDPPLLTVFLSFAKKDSPSCLFALMVFFLYLRYLQL